MTNAVQEARPEAPVQVRRFRLLGPAGRFVISTVFAIAILFAIAIAAAAGVEPDHEFGTTFGTISADVTFDAGLVMYLVLTYLLFRREPAARIRARAIVRYGHWRAGLRKVSSFIWIVLGLFFAVLAVGTAFDLRDIGIYAPDAQLAAKVLEAASVLLTWLMLHAVYAEFYATRYYRERGGLDIAGTEAPDYRDFAYFSFSIGMTFGTTDVNVTSSSFRRVMLPHKLFSFGFNTAILALVIDTFTK